MEKNLEVETGTIQWFIGIRVSCGAVLYMGGPYSALAFQKQGVPLNWGSPNYKDSISVFLGLCCGPLFVATSGE